MDADVRALFERSIHDAVDRHSGAALDRALATLGWHDALTESTRDAVSILFERQGAKHAVSSALGAVMVAALDTTAEGVVLPALGRWRPPATIEGGRVVVDGLVLGSPDQAVAVAPGDDTDVAVVVDVRALEVQPSSGIDAALELAVVGGTTAITDTRPVDWGAAVTAGQRAIAHELIGASRTMLELARVHALERMQFGRPIAMFQAVRHRLADTLVAIETADAAVDAAWIDGSAVTAAMAKALAGRAARTAARHCQQVLAGIGFTTEHDLHLSVRRVLVLDQLLGSSKALTAELGTRLLATRQLPPLLPL